MTPEERDQRRALVLRLKRDGQSFAEIGAAIGVSASRAQQLYCGAFVCSRPASMAVFRQGWIYLLPGKAFTLPRRSSRRGTPTLSAWAKALRRGRCVPSTAVRSSSRVQRGP